MRKTAAVVMVCLFVILTAGAASAALIDDLVAYYPFNGNANDESGSGNNGAVHGAVLSEDRYGKPDKAYSFNGTDSYIEINNSSSLEMGYSDYSIAAWIKTAATSNNGRIFSKGSSGCLTGYMMRMGGGNSAYIHFENAYNYGCYTFFWGSIPVNDDNWHCVVGVTDRKQGSKIYVDGKLDTERAVNTSSYDLTNGRNPTIGKNDVGNYVEFFKGEIDEVRVYRRTLSETEVQELCRKNSAPVADAGADQVAEMTSCNGAAITLNGSGSSDPDGDVLTYTWSWSGGSAMGASPAVILPYGTTTLTLTVDDGNGESATDTVAIRVVDTTAPGLNVSVSPSTLWPPNHKYIKVRPAVTATDACTSSVNLELVSATSNESDNGLGDGDTANDVVINADGSLSLRAERSGTGSGRVYSITYKATDIGGNSTTGVATVTVPHDR
jgi:hypothetical protein